MAKALNRRTFLRGSGFCLALPWLDAMRPAIAKGAGPDATPRRMVAIETNMGILPQFFFPEEAGKDYKPGPYLEKLAAHRPKMTVFSGVSLPGVTGAHAAEKCFLTGTPHPERGGFRNWVSLDQHAAEHIGNETRIPVAHAGDDQRRGLHAQLHRAAARRSRPRGARRKLFQKLFVQGKPEEVDGQRRGDSPGPQHARLRRPTRAKRLDRSLSGADRRRMDQYLHLGPRPGKAARTTRKPGNTGPNPRSTPSRPRTSRTPASSSSRRA